VALPVHEVKQGLLLRFFAVSGSYADFSRVVDSASRAVDQAEQDGGFLRLRQHLPDWIELVSKLRQANVLRDVPEADISRFLSTLELPIGSGCVTLDNNVAVSVARAGPSETLNLILSSVKDVFKYL